MEHFNLLYVVLILIGTIPGYYLGRWRAETGRAIFDMRRVWDRRSLYRDLDDF